MLINSIFFFYGTEIRYFDIHFQMKFPYRFIFLYSDKNSQNQQNKNTQKKAQKLIHSLYSLQVESASSEPSGHSGSPSHLHRAGTHCPFLHAKSVVAHVFFAVKKREKKISTGNIHLQKWFWCKPESL